MSKIKAADLLKSSKFTGSREKESKVAVVSKKLFRYGRSSVDRVYISLNTRGMEDIALHSDGSNQKITAKRFWSSVFAASGFAGMTFLFTRLNDFLPSWISDWFKWCPTSAAALKKAEKKLLSYLKQPFELQFVNIPAKKENDNEYGIHTLFMNTNVQDDKKKIPLVLMHGLASGIGLWILNLDSLSQNRPLYTFDIPGFGRSSRPNFSKDAVEVEKQLVSSIEEWREQMGLQKFILLGHSMGGFLASSYALQYPDRIHHLILADPWGFPEPSDTFKKFKIPFYVKTISTVLQFFNPLAGLRAAGPLGPKLIEKIRPDILQKFSTTVENIEDISNYIYHCNAQVPSGEAAFKTMTLRFGWAKSPMLPRIIHLCPEVPITFIYGSRSWIDCESGFRVKELREDAFVDVKLIPGAGHHVYADKAEIFNSIVISICDESDTSVSCDHKHLSENDCSVHINGSLKSPNLIDALEHEDKDTASDSLVI